MRRVYCWFLVGVVQAFLHGSVLLYKLARGAERAKDYLALHGIGVSARRKLDAKDAELVVARARIISLGTKMDMYEAISVGYGKQVLAESLKHGFVKLEQLQAKAKPVASA